MVVQLWPAGLTLGSSALNIPILLVAASCIVECICEVEEFILERQSCCSLSITANVPTAKVSWLESCAATESSNLYMYFCENAIYSCFNSFRYDQGRDSSQHYLNDYEDNPSRENEEVSSYYLGTLESSKNSGLSSSSYELSQYINGAEHSEPAHTSDAGECTVKALFFQLHFTQSLSWHLFLCAGSDHGPVHQTSAPLKYSIPHAIVSFGPAGQLIRVTPGLSTQESVSQLEIHSMEVRSTPACVRLSSF